MLSLMASVSTPAAYIAPLNASFDDPRCAAHRAADWRETAIMSTARLPIGSLGSVFGMLWACSLASAGRNKLMSNPP